MFHVDINMSSRRDYRMTAETGPVLQLLSDKMDGYNILTADKILDEIGYW